MSDLTNRAAYLKGLADGMKLDKESNEGKLLNEIIALLGDITEEMEMIDDEQGFIADKLDDIDESIDILCEEVFEDELYEYDEDDFDEEDEFAIKCEKCGKDVFLSYEDLEYDDLACPYCGEPIEIEFECDGDCEGCE